MIRRRGHTEAQPLRIELAGLPTLPTLPHIPSDVTIRHVIERKPGPAPARMWVTVTGQAGYHYQGMVTYLNNPNGRASLQLPSGAQICMRDRDSGEYIPLGHIDVEYAWERVY